MRGFVYLAAPLLLGAAAVAADRPVGAVSGPQPMSGKELYEHWCAACHDPGAGHPGTLRMAGDYGEGMSVLLTKKDVTRDLVTYAVRNGFNMMPPFRPTEITDEELDRLADYIAGAAL
jgi:mono/diheme cytochrome c family protein